MEGEDRILQHLLKKYKSIPESPVMSVLKPLRAEDYARFPPPTKGMSMQEFIHEHYTDISVIQALNLEPQLLSRLQQLLSSGRLLSYALNRRKGRGDLVHYFDHIWVLVGEGYERLVLFRQANDVLIPLYYCGQQFENGHVEYTNFLNQLDARWREIRQDQLP